MGVIYELIFTIFIRLYTKLLKSYYLIGFQAKCKQLVIDQ